MRIISEGDDWYMPISERTIDIHLDMRIKSIEVSHVIGFTFMKWVAL